MANQRREDKNIVCEGACFSYGPPHSQRVLMLLPLQGVVGYVRLFTHGVAIGLRAFAPSGRWLRSVHIVGVGDGCVSFVYPRRFRWA